MSKFSSTNSLKEQCPIKNFTKQHNSEMSKLKACEDNKRINVGLEMTKFVLDWVENISSILSRSPLELLCDMINIA